MEETLLCIVLNIFVPLLTFEKLPINEIFDNNDNWLISYIAIQ